MMPDLVRHPTFLIPRTFLFNVRDDFFLQPELHSHGTLIYLSVCHILIVLHANAMRLSTNNHIIIGKRLHSL